MSIKRPLIVLMAVVLLVGVAGSAAAHEWQHTVTQGPMELGVSSSPADPVAGMEAEFSARIADDQVDAGEPNRLSWGGVTNTTVEVHIRGPDGIHDHTTAEIPADDAHFHFTYVFPTDGTYTIAIVAELEGEEYAFQFQKNVSLLPAEATGDELAELSSDVSAVKDDVNHVHEEVEATNERLDAIQSELADADSGPGQAIQAGVGVTVTLVVLTAIAAFAAGRRF